MASLLITAVLMISSIGALAPKVHAQTATISILPASIDNPALGPGSSISISANAADISDVFTWQVTVFFDPTILSCTGMAVPTGTIFGPPNLPIVVSPLIDNVLGSASIGASTILGPTATGSGVLTTLNFSVIGRGTTALTFGKLAVDTFFLNTNLNDIPVTLVVGSFSNFVAPPTAKIFVNPSSVVNPALTTGTTFDVKLSIQNGTGVHRWAADVAFNNTLLSGVQAVEGPFLNGSGSTTFNATIQNDFSATEGRILLSCELTTGGASGNGDLVTITFSVLTTGSTPLTLSSVDLRDSAGTALPFTTANGFFSNVSVRDIAVESVSIFNDVIAKGFMIDTTEVHITLNVTVGVVNNGDTTETFNVGIYVDSVLAAPMQLVENLTSHEERTLEFLWDTFDATLGNHTLSASAEILSGESNTENNTFVYGQIKVIFPGDVNQDGIVDMRDVAVIVLSFNAFYDNPGRFNHFADLDANGRIEMRDIGIWGVNFGQTYNLPV
jgi:hypothetical protein